MGVSKMVNYELSITNYQLRIINYGLSITDYQLRIINYELRNINYELKREKLNVERLGLVTYSSFFGKGIPAAVEAMKQSWNSDYKNNESDDFSVKEMQFHGFIIETIGWIYQFVVCTLLAFIIHGS